MYVLYYFKDLTIICPPTIERFGRSFPRFVLYIDRKKARNKLTMRGRRATLHVNDRT